MEPVSGRPLSIRQRVTLELGSWILVAGALTGIEIGAWPAWTLLALATAYCAWVLSYAEVTVRLERRRGLLAEPQPTPRDEEQAA